MFCFVFESSPGDANVRAGIESGLDSQLEFLNNKNMCYDKTFRTIRATVGKLLLL